MKTVSFTMMDRKRIDINDIVRNQIGYRSDREDFGAICQEANKRINHMGWDIERSKTKLFQLFGEPTPYITMDDLGVSKPLNVFGTELIDGEAIKQMETALRLPTSFGGAIMPDGHLGYALPIGGVLAMENSISPHFIGFDISCMMKLSVIDVTVKDFIKNKDYFAKKLKGVTSFGLGADFADGKRDHEIMEDPLWDEVEILRSLKSKAQAQLGSSGGGNHFADVMIGRDFNTGENERVFILTHSGSRGTGHKVATHYAKLAKRYTDSVAKGIPNGYEWLPLDSEDGAEYFKVMELMGRYASANHELIHKHYGKALMTSVTHELENKHNFAWKEKHFGRELIVHRKGATPASKGERGIIPSSMATDSYVVKGLGNPLSFNSSSHGAGRYTSRTKAKEQFNAEEHEDVITKKGIIAMGVDADESYQSYKNIQDVMHYQEGILVNTIMSLTPHIVLMGGNQKSDDGD